MVSHSQVSVFCNMLGKFQIVNDLQTVDILLISRDPEFSLCSGKMHIFLH